MYYARVYVKAPHSHTRLNVASMQHAFLMEPLTAHNKNTSECAALLSLRL